MSIRSRIIVAVAVVSFGFASPALAQSFSNGWGTGNNLPSYYSADGGLRHGGGSTGYNWIAEHNY